VAGEAVGGAGGGGRRFRRGKEAVYSICLAGEGGTGVGQSWKSAKPPAAAKGRVIVVTRPKRSLESGTVKRAEGEAMGQGVVQEW